MVIKIILRLKILPLTFITLFFVSTNLFGQDNNQKEVDSTGIKIPKAIPVINLIEEIDLANDNLKDFERKIEPSSSIKKIDSLYPVFKEFISVERQKAKQFIRSNPNQQKANNLLRQWKRYYSHLESWQSTISNSFERNSLLKDNIEFQIITWELTSEKVKEEELATPIIAQIDNLINDLNKTKEKIINQNKEELTLETKINFQMSLVNDVIDSIDELKSSSVYNILYKRHPVLWNTSFDSSQTQVPVNKNSAYRIIKLEFWKTYKTPFLFYCFILVLIVFFVIYQKKAYSKDPHNRLASEKEFLLSPIYKKTVFTIVFIALLVAKLLFKNVPDVANHILELSLLLSLIPILDLRLKHKFKYLVYVVILFFILNVAKTYIWFESFQYRLYLLLESLLVLICLYYFTHPVSQFKTLSNKKIRVILLVAIPFLYVLLFIAIASNILGYTNLTDLCLEICTYGFVITAIFYAILILLFSFSHSIIHRQYVSKEIINEKKVVETKRKTRRFSKILVFLSWLLVLLSILDFLQPIQNFVNDFLTDPYNVGEITFTIGSIVTFIMILILSYGLTKFISFVFDDGSDAIKISHLPRGIPNTISVVLRYLILAFGVVFAISSLGIDLSKFNLMAGALGLGIGFGLQNVISNFVSGLILIFERPILAGDTVEFDNLMGTVKKIGVRSSKVSTFDGADVVVPNNNLVSNDLINWTLSSSIRRIEILIGTTYGSDPNKVLEILKTCADTYPEVIKDPAPVALFSEFGDSSLNFKLRFWVHFSIGLKAKSDVSIAVYNALKDHNIEIPFPQQDIHIKDMPNNAKE